MPRIPQYDQQAELRPLPNARQDTIASPALLSGNADATNALGRGLMNFGGAVGDIAAKMQDRENADLIFQAETVFNEGANKTVVEARQRRGANAKNVANDVDTALLDIATKSSEGLTNDVQRKLFEQQVTKSRGRIRGAMGEFEWNERRQSVVESTTAVIGTTVQSAAAAAALGFLNTTPASGGAQAGEAKQTLDENGNPVATTPPVDVMGGAHIGAFKKDIQAHLAVLADVNGWTPSKLAFEEAKFVSQMHESVLRNLVDTNPKAAKQYFDNFKTEIDGTKLGNLDKLVKTGTSVMVGQTIRDEIIAKGLTEDQALAYVREKYEGEDEKNGRSAVVEYFGDINRGSQRKQLNAGDEAWRIYNERGTLSAIPASVRNDMDPKAWAALRDHAENKAKGRDTKTDTATWLDVQSKILSGAIKDPKELLQYSNKLSAGDIKSFSTLIGKPDKVIEAKIDTDDFNGIADSVGLKPFEPKKSEDDRRNLGLLKQRVEQVIDVEQRNRGRQLTRSEKQELMRREVNNKVMLDTFGRDPEVPVGMVPADQVDKAYVNVNGEEVRLSAIPPDVRAEIQQEINAYNSKAAREGRPGLPVTESLIATMWTRAGKPKTSKAASKPSLVDAIPK
jgi:hypothetical protein